MCHKCVFLLYIHCYIVPEYLPLDACSLFVLNYLYIYSQFMCIISAVGGN